MRLSAGTAGLLLCVGLCSANGSECQQPQPREIAKSVWLIPGGFPQNREPDGNTIVFAGDGGLVVMDTGRHPWHTQAILDFAKRQKQPIVAIINSHWHLDHTTGNRALKAAFPQAKVYATSAIDSAIASFFPKSAAGDKQYLESGHAHPDTAEDVRGDLDVMANPDALRPDIVVKDSTTMQVGGLDLELDVARNAATDADLWAYFDDRRLVATGDLVTLPVPFFDTACAGGWQKGLDAISAKNFEIAIPGHGEPMTREQFEAYRKAYAAFVGCTKSDHNAADCAAEWLHSAAGLGGAAPVDDPRANEMARSYVEMLRAHGGNSAFCKAADR